MLGPRLWELAKRAGLSPDQLSKRSGIPVKTLYMYGSKNPKARRGVGDRNAPRLASALGLTVDELAAEAGVPMSEAVRLERMILDLDRRLTRLEADPPPDTPPDPAEPLKRPEPPKTRRR